MRDGAPAVSSAARHRTRACRHARSRPRHAKREEGQDILSRTRGNVWNFNDLSQGVGTGIYIGKSPSLHVRLSVSRKRKRDSGERERNWRENDKDARKNRAMCESSAGAVKSIAWIHLDKLRRDQSPGD